MMEEFGEHFGAVLDEDDDHAHEGAAGDDAGGDGQGEFLGGSGGFFAEPPADQRPEEKEDAVVPLKDPRKAEAGN